MNRAPWARFEGEHPLKAPYSKFMASLHTESSVGTAPDPFMNPRGDALHHVDSSESRSNVSV
jgi:hypothetical protein